MRRGKRLPRAQGKGDGITRAVLHAQGKQKPIACGHGAAECDRFGMHTRCTPVRARWPRSWPYRRSAHIHNAGRTAGEGDPGSDQVEPPQPSALAWHLEPCTDAPFLSVAIQAPWTPFSSAATPTSGPTSPPSNPTSSSPSSARTTPPPGPWSPASPTSTWSSTTSTGPAVAVTFRRDGSQPVDSSSGQNFDRPQLRRIEFSGQTGLTLRSEGVIADHNSSIPCDLPAHPDAPCPRPY